MNNNYGTTDLREKATAQTKDLLEEYTASVMEINAVEAKKAEIIDTILTPEIKEQLAALDAEFDPNIEALRQKQSKLEAQIKKNVAVLGSTIRNDLFMAVYNSPRVSWNNEMLEGFMPAYPQLEQAKSVGKPSVSIRRTA